MVSAVSSSSQVYAVHFRHRRHSSLADSRCLEASSIEEAREKAKNAVAEAYPNGCVLLVCPVKKSPWWVKDAQGKYVNPSTL